MRGTTKPRPAASSARQDTGPRGDVAASPRSPGPDRGCPAPGGDSVRGPAGRGPEPPRPSLPSTRPQPAHPRRQPPAGPDPPARQLRGHSPRRRRLLPGRRRSPCPERRLLPQLPAPAGPAPPWAPPSGRQGALTRARPLTCLSARGEGTAGDGWRWPRPAG